MPGGDAGPGMPGRECGAGAGARAGGGGNEARAALRSAGLFPDLLPAPHLQVQVGWESDAWFS